MYRKYLILALLFLGGRKIGRYLKEIQQLEKASAGDIKQHTEQKLKQLLLHAAQNVPYYRKILPESGVVANGIVRLENFSRTPLLTKDIIRQQGEKLYSSDAKNRKPYTNTSGGSTGEPVSFLQDKKYDDWNNATKIYFNTVLGKQLGQREIKFWGSDRDILEGTLAIKDRLINWLYNRKFFNSYRLNDALLNDLIKLNNTFKPKAYWSYMESALELADFLSGNDIDFHSPEIVISTIGPLTPPVKERIEAGMGCKVYNQYGSREVGVIACQCKEQKGLHTFPWWNHVEVVNADGSTVEYGQGNLVITTLHNYSMPLIRYDIGDVAVMGDNECPCGRKTTVLDSVIGRTLGYFKKADGTRVHSHFIVQALFFRNWIQRFQIVQEAFDRVVLLIEPKDGNQPNEEDLVDIRNKTQVIMGSDCTIETRIVDKIERSQSGKFVYTICKIT